MEFTPEEPRIIYYFVPGFIFILPAIIFFLISGGWEFVYEKPEGFVAIVVSVAFVIGFLIYQVYRKFIDWENWKKWHTNIYEDIQKNAKKWRKINLEWDEALILWQRVQDSNKEKSAHYFKLTKFYFMYSVCGWACVGGLILLLFFYLYRYGPHDLFLFRDNLQLIALYIIQVYFTFLALCVYGSYKTKGYFIKIAKTTYEYGGDKKRIEQLRNVQEQCLCTFQENQLPASPPPIPWRGGE